MDDRESALHTRPSLLVRIRDPGDAEAWRTFLSTYTPLVFGYCRRYGLQDSDTADVTQEVMAQVARSMRGFAYEPDRGRFRDWLGAVTRSKLVEFFRGRDRAPRPSGGDAFDLDKLASTEADTLWDDEFRARVLRVAMDRVKPCFEPPSWRAFERTWLDGIAAAAAARELGLPIEAVYLAKSRVLKRLREEVMALAEDLPLAVTVR
jgi:RNA polymerase sigma-70 factor (ECF subfamily)